MDNLLKDHRCPILCEFCKGWALTIERHQISALLFSVFSACPKRISRRVRFLCVLCVNFSPHSKIRPALR